jgi:hypothetical protein
MSEYILILECEVGQPVIDNGSPIPIGRHILGLEAHHASQKGFLKVCSIIEIAHTNVTAHCPPTYQDGETGGSFFFLSLSSQRSDAGINPGHRPPRAGHDKPNGHARLRLDPTPPTVPTPSRSPIPLPAHSSGSGMAHSGPGKLSAVDAILAEAADLVALEQIAKLNTAHLARDDSALPSTLESRFRKLKSLPAAPAPVKTLGRSITAPHASTLLHPPQPNPTPPAPTPQEEQQPREDADNTSPPPQQPVRDDHDDEDLFGGSGGAGRGRPMLRERNRGRDDDSSTSPPRQACCLFGFSPKKPPPPPTKGKKGPAGDRGVDADQWGDENRRMVTELKEQQRQLKKALQEQVTVSRETAKMARMAHTAAIDDLLSDCEEDDDFFK